MVPAFNETPDVVRASLESLRAQSFADFECIVIDESTLADRAGGCREVCEEDPRFVYLQPAQRLGLSRSLNLGIERARGEFIARFDSDDVCAPDRLARQVAFLESHRDVGIVGGGLEIMDENGLTLAFRDYPLSHAAIARSMHTTNAVAHPTVMFRRQLAALHGVYNPEFGYSEDLDLWLRWMNAGVVFANLPGVLVRYRQEHTRRSAQHWRYNLRARTRNFAAQHLLRRMVGISGVAVWIALPASVQETVFRSFVLRHQRKQKQP